MSNLHHVVYLSVPLCSVSCVHRYVCECVCTYVCCVASLCCGEKFKMHSSNNYNYCLNVSCSQSFSTSLLDSIHKITKRTCDVEKTSCWGDLLYWRMFLSARMRRTITCCSHWLFIRLRLKIKFITANVYISFFFLHVWFGDLQYIPGERMKILLIHTRLAGWVLKFI